MRGGTTAMIEKWKPEPGEQPLYIPISQLKHPLFAKEKPFSNSMAMSEIAIDAIPGKGSLLINKKEYAERLGWSAEHLTWFLTGLVESGIVTASGNEDDSVNIEFTDFSLWIYIPE